MGGRLVQEPQCRSHHCQSRTVILAYKLREAMIVEMKDATVGGDGSIVEVDGCYVGGHIRLENRKEDRKDRRLAENQTGKREVVVAIRKRDGRTLTAVFKSVNFIKARVEKGNTIHTDEGKGWEKLRAKFPVKVVNHSLAYSTDDACTNQAESFFSRLRRAELGQHHHISGIYLGRYAGEMAWREDHRRKPIGTLFSIVAKRAGSMGQSVDFCGYWQRSKIS